MSEKMNQDLDRQDAATLLFEALHIGDNLNKMMEVLDQVKASKSKDKFVEMIGLVMGHNADMIFAVRKMYPDLHPIFRTLKK
jgi:hypothetical protein